MRLKQSCPFPHNERIVTPTLFMVGDKAFDVPVPDCEKMDEALKSRGVATGLVIHPGQFHGFKRPNVLKDRIRRWLAWYDAHGSALPPVAGVR